MSGRPMGLKLGWTDQGPAIVDRFRDHRHGGQRRAVPVGAGSIPWERPRIVSISLIVAGIVGLRLA